MNPKREAKPSDSMSDVALAMIKEVGTPAWYRRQQATATPGKSGIGVPGKTRKNREKNARTIQNRIKRAEKQRAKK